MTHTRLMVWPPYLCLPLWAGALLPLPQAGGAQPLKPQVCVQARYAASAENSGKQGQTTFFCYSWFGVMLLLSLRSCYPCLDAHLSSPPATQCM